MANTLTTMTITAALRGTASGAAGLGNASSSIEEALSMSFTGGGGALQVSKMYSAERTLALSTSEDLDLAGVLLDDLTGAAVTFATVKIVMIRANAANVNNVIVGGASANAFIGWFGSATDTESIMPGGFVFRASPAADGWAVTAATADKLKVLNGGAGTSVTYRIFILGD